ncbi:restriction endonuclease subunit S [Salinibacterium sp. NG253]|uniref:restriction endonuclease subunit S n=1 Tax=Salinibacterium sp. NG253 TaxID=2792039 RepID=UPI0018CDDA7E|nr:restriction endonuclease subunit S [Salinibacterium sp. NG253]MBH0117138.1 restriction endonuclease subunit S [Salinibacterium sp. NG253]
MSYGNKFDFNKMKVTPAGICFVGRSGKKQGVSGRVARVGQVAPYKPGLLTVALGGASRLATFVQSEPFYTAQNVAVLQPKTPMTLVEKLYWATCIQANRFRYEGFGREANRTLATLELPDRPPEWISANQVVEQLTSMIPPITASESGVPRAGAAVGDLFEVRYGQSLELNRLHRVAPPSGVNFVSRTDRNNGVSARVKLPVGETPGESGELSVALGGSPLATFLQPEAFVCGRDVAILKPRTPMSDAEKLYWAMCIRSNRYRFSFGRQANRTLADLALPALPEGLASNHTVSTVIGDLRASLVKTRGGFRIPVTDGDPTGMLVSTEES